MRTIDEYNVTLAKSALMIGTREWLLVRYNGILSGRGYPYSYILTFSLPYMTEISVVIRQ